MKGSPTENLGIRNLFRCIVFPKVQPSLSGMELPSADRSPNRPPQRQADGLAESGLTQHLQEASVHREATNKALGWPRAAVPTGGGQARDPESHQGQEPGRFRRPRKAASSVEDVRDPSSPIPHVAP